MNDWKKKFEQSMLERGKASYLNKRVADLKETDVGYTAAVLGRQRFEVSIRTAGGTLGRMSCNCSVARSGRNCEHMAAALYAVEARTQAAADKLTESELMEKWRQMDAAIQEEEEQRKAKEAHRLAEKRKKAAERAAEKLRAKEAKEEEKRRAEEAEKEAAKAEEERLRREKEQEERRLAREKRKAERERKKEEQRRLEEEARRKENEKRLAEEARREKIRKQKQQDAQRKAEKKQEEARLNAEREQKEKEARRLAEEKRREEEKQRMEAEKQRMEAEKQEAQKRLRQEEAEEKRRMEYTLLGSPWEGDSDTQEIENSDKNIARLENYSYFQGKQIRNSLKISKSVAAEGEKLYSQGMIEIDNIMTGYSQYEDGIMGQIEAVGTSGNEKFPIDITFSRTAVVSSECRCPNCRKNYYSWYTKKSSCPYEAEVLKLLEEYLDTHNIGDATDQNAHRLMTLYQEKRANLMIVDAAAKKESLMLVPRLVRKDGKLSVSFRIGEKRMFVIKKLDKFCQNVKDSATDIYGSSTKLNHSLENFNDKSKKWIRFINRVVREEVEFQRRISESRYYYYRKCEVGGELNLFGWRLDEFYEQMADETIEFDDRDGWEKKKRNISCVQGNPKMEIKISEEKLKGEREFHGVMVKGNLPAMYFGTDTAYFIKDDYFCRVDKEILEKIEPLTSLTDGETFSFHVGRNNMSEFYYRILPELREIAEITETDPKKFRAYLPPEAHFVFYIDAEEQNVTCNVYARYGEKEVPASDVLCDDALERVEPFRDAAREEEILLQVMQWFPEMDEETGEFHCGGDEERIYQVIEKGTESLMELGEVRCTKRFLGYHAVRSVKVSVGVSVSSGLLELDISTEDVPRNELLDILNSYRAKKKYYRLKDGSFVNLEDPSLEMLAELANAAHLKPKDLVKGKMHLPMYRTLYLDKMLEENEEVYSSRDSHFKEVVKDFKTVKDADFEVPQSLSKIMRKYQENGYKWMRTLETWQFGGILADDMGLGKTLQAVSVLLASKQEGKEGTSLIVTPASLVFNWQEEMERFAPEMAVSVITGTQDERQAKIDAYRESDVLVTSYDLLKRDIAFYEEKQFLYEIIDEAQYIKNHTTAAAKAVKVINSRIRYALTGTPVENRLSELWSIFDYLMPGFLYSYDVFKKEMETPIVKNKDEAAMKRLQKMVSPFILRRLKENVLKDLPEKLEECRYVKFADTQQKLYDAQALHMRESIARQDHEEFQKNRMQILAELTRLRQICCDPSLCFENYRGEAAKLEACLELIQSAMDGGHRILVFSQFTSMLDIMQNQLTALGISYYTITGNTSKEKRLQLVKEFNEGEVPVFLISLKAGGVGLNLTGADVVIHYDPWWNLAVQNQATDRAHRIGQTKKVTVYKLIAKNTIEEKIQKLQETKRDLAEQVIGGEAGKLGSLSREDILELLEIS